MLIALISLALAASPARDGYVTDLADLLPADTESDMEQVLAGYHASTGFEVAVLVVPTIGHEDGLAYGTAVRKDWNLGGPDRNAVLLVVVPPPEKILAVVTAPGTRPYLTDAQARHIREDVVRPLNLEERRAEAVVAGTQAVMEALGTTPVWERPAIPRTLPPPTGARAAEADTTAFWCIGLAALFAVGVFLWAFFGRRNRSSWGGGGYGGGGYRSSGYSNTTIYTYTDVSGPSGSSAPSGDTSSGDSGNSG